MTAVGAAGSGCESNCQILPIYSENGGVFGGSGVPIGNPSSDMVGAFDSYGDNLADLIAGQFFQDLHLERVGEGAQGGWVESITYENHPDGEPDGRIVCGDRCTESYRMGELVTLRINVEQSAVGGAIFAEE